MSAVYAQAALLVSVAIISLSQIFAGNSSPVARYTLMWACFHLSEYWCTKTYLSRTLTPYLFLMWGARGSMQLAGVHCASICEYMLMQKYGRFFGLLKYGMFLAAAGILVRARAICDCGDSFSHYIETEAPQVLVTSGIYAWCRHPSYTGFLLYVVGMQIIVGNVFIFALCLVVLFRFFTRRIEIEEHFLVNCFYGDRYLQYKARVRALVPYIY